MTWKYIVLPFRIINSSNIFNAKCSWAHLLGWKRSSSLVIFGGQSFNSSSRNTLVIQTKSELFLAMASKTALYASIRVANGYNSFDLYAHGHSRSANASIPLPKARDGIPSSAGKSPIRILKPLPKWARESLINDLTFSVKDFSW